MVVVDQNLANPTALEDVEDPVERPAMAVQPAGEAGFRGLRVEVVPLTPGQPFGFGVVEDETQNQEVGRPVGQLVANGAPLEVGAPSRPTEVDDLELRLGSEVPQTLFESIGVGILGIDPGAPTYRSRRAP